jgi:endonuclease III-like uncharacterized protein
VGRGFTEVEAYLAPGRAATCLRQDLLSLAGVGPETADAILTFASEAHPSFVVDEYTRRAFRRLGVFAELGEDFWSRPYGRLQRFFEGHVLTGLALYDGFEFAPGVRREAALFRDFHAQLVELGKHQPGSALKRRNRLVPVPERRTKPSRIPPLRRVGIG